MSILNGSYKAAPPPIAPAVPGTLASATAAPAVIPTAPSVAAPAPAPAPAAAVVTPVATPPARKALPTIQMRSPRLWRKIALGALAGLAIVAIVIGVGSRFRGQPAAKATTSMSVPAEATSEPTTPMSDKDAAIVKMAQLKSQRMFDRWYAQAMQPWMTSMEYDANHVLGMPKWMAMFLCILAGSSIGVIASILYMRRRYPVAQRGQNTP